MLISHYDVNFIFLATCSKIDLDVVFLIDISSPTRRHNIKSLSNSLKSFIISSSVDSGKTRIGIVTYSSKVYVQCYLNTCSSKLDLLSAIDQITYVPGNRNTADGIQIVRNNLFNKANGDRPKAANILIVITNGLSDMNVMEIIPEAEMSRDVDIEIFAVGIGIKVTDEIYGIAGSTSNTFLIERHEELEDSLTSIQDKICSGKLRV